MLFLTIAAAMVLWSCVTYLKLQAETTSRVKNIAALETELEDLKKENDDNYTRIMTSVDLDYISGCFLLALIHPHIKSCIFPVSETSVCFIKLIRGYSQIQNDTVHTGHPSVP